MGSERQLMACKRMTELGAGEATFESKLGEAISQMVRKLSQRLNSVLTPMRALLRTQLDATFILTPHPPTPPPSLQAEGLSASGLFASLGVYPERSNWPNPSWAHAEEAYESYVIITNRCARKGMMCSCEP